MQSKIPFAVVGSDQEVDTPDGRTVRGRSYPWGVVEVDNEDHCDFVKLRQMLVRTYMEELREHTNSTLYENWRSEKLHAMGVAQDSSVFKEVNPAAKMAEERTLHEAKLAKMEAEMRMVFQQKVSEKEARLKQSEEELYARHKEMKEALEKQRGELEDKKRRIESGRPITPEKVSVVALCPWCGAEHLAAGLAEEGFPPPVDVFCSHFCGWTSPIVLWFALCPLASCLIYFALAHPHSFVCRLRSPPPARVTRHIRYLGFLSSLLTASPCVCLEIVYEEI